MHVNATRGAAPRYLIVLRGPRVEGPPQEELGDHAAQGPHVDGLAERQAQDDLRSSAQEREENTHHHFSDIVAFQVSCTALLSVTATSLSGKKHNDN